MRPWRRWKLGLPSGPKDTTSPSTHRLVGAQRAAQLAQLRVARRDVATVAARQPQPAALDVAERPHPVPLDLVGPAPVVGRELPGAGEHRLELLRHRLAIRVLGRIHAVDHPVLAAGAEQDVLALEPLAVEGDHHLVGAELVQLVRPAVPDAHRAGAVVALGDLALELEVLERVVLGAHREVVALRVRRDPLGHRPRRQRALVLEAQIPVQRAGVVLLDDVAGAAFLDLAGRRLGGRLEVALGPIGPQPVGHRRQTVPAHAQVG